MRFLRILWRVELRALAALATCTLLMGVVGAVGNFFWKSPVFDPLESGSALAFYTAVVGFLPVVLYGAPAYATAIFLRRPAWLVPLALGAAPGIVLIPYERGLGFYFLVCGPLVGALTHIYSRSLLVIRSS